MRPIELIVEMLPEEASIQGSAVATGDDTCDRGLEDKIFADLTDGNDWAWCAVKVTARIAGIEGVDYRGCCSFNSEEDFHEGGTYEDMVEQAIWELHDKLTDTLDIVTREIRGR